MPNRIVRDGFLDSEVVNALGDQAECFYHRLLLAADDAGRMDGRVEMLRARLFPLSSRRASDVEKQLSDCVRLGLVIPYEWGGKPYVQLAKVQRCSPCTNSKFPWKDGSHKITYVKRETRDGEKEFVLTSLSLADGMPMGLGESSVKCPETLTLTDTKTETTARKRAEFPCPADWIPADAWQAFVEHRQAKRAKLTGKAVELIVADLADFRKRGVEPRTVLEWAIKQGHTGLFYKPDPKNPPPKMVLAFPDCNVPGCKREGMPGLGGRCEAHYESPRRAYA